MMCNCLAQNFCFGFRDEPYWWSDLGERVVLEMMNETPLFSLDMLIGN
jgi:hypothetical protein